MNHLLHKLGTVFGTSALMLLASTSLASAQSNFVSGNGAFSHNAVMTNSINRTNVRQTNNSDITNRVNAFANSGRNEANFNTGGRTSIFTGPADVAVSIRNGGNTNFASINNCMTCGFGRGNVDITGNGAFSRNLVNTRFENITRVNQVNNTRIMNDVNAFANSGRNEANFNTKGFTSINTGRANALVNIMNGGSRNILLIH